MYAVRIVLHSWHALFMGVQDAGHTGMTPVVVAGVVIVLHPVACMCSGCKVL
jgi:hypothetical protein